MISSKVDNGKITRYIDHSKTTELGIGHKEFLAKATTVYGESSAYRENGVSTELKNEMFAIASVHEKNDIAYGDNSPSAKAFRNKSSIERNGGKMQLAIAAEINAQLGGKDYSNGTTNWDGKEQGQYPVSDNRRSTGRFELHMNTVGWTISYEHYTKWKNNIGKSFVAPQEKAAIFSPNKGMIRNTSTAVYLQTIFWKQK